MAQRTIASSGTGAITAGNQVEFSISAKHFRHGKKPIISVSGLATTETVSFYYWTGGSWEELDDGSGTQVAFTATYAADVFGYIKDATAGAITVHLDDGL
jgi:hypothetical protein